MLPLETPDRDLYKVLGLPSPADKCTVDAAEIKAAIRRALLKYHPDKGNNGKPSDSTSAQLVDVDLIRLARAVLTDPIKRREYDIQLLRQGTSLPVASSRAEVRSHPTELDTVDLDDMDYHAETLTWTRTCRCGNLRAYEVTEEDLETAAMCGSSEVLVGCEGCSLHVRVMFEVADVDGDEDKDKVEENVIHH